MIRWISALLILLLASSILGENIYAFKLDKGFWIEYGECDLTVESSMDFLRIALEQNLKQELEKSFCSLLENARFEYDYTEGNNVWTKKVTDKGTEPVRFFGDFGDGRLHVILPLNWEKGDPLRYSFGQLTNLEYKGTEEVIINDQQLVVYEFEGEKFVEQDGIIGKFYTKNQYDSESGFLVSSYNFAEAAHPMGSASLRLDFIADDITPPKTSLTNLQENNGCLIATASFGSEFSPQVQLLREVRDNVVLGTKSGSAFMTGFNEFYYSFSPYVADLERQNPVFKEVVKLTISPMLSTLSILDYVDIDSEQEMLGYGLGIILLNVGMYFVVPAIVVVKLTKNLSFLSKLHTAEVTKSRN